MTLTPPPALSLSDIPRGGRLIDRLAAGTPFGLVFGGQGNAWLEPLGDLVATHGLELAGVVDEAERRLRPVHGELMRAGAAFAPLEWLDDLATRTGAPPPDGSSAGPQAVASATGDVTSPVLSLPGILLAQLAALRALSGLGLDPHGAIATAGYSQGRLAVACLEELTEAEALVVARLAGAAAGVVARRRGLLGTGTMLSVSLALPQAKERLAALPASARVVAGLASGRRASVLCGPAAGIERAAGLFTDVRSEPIAAGAAFHHPDLLPAVELAASWAQLCGLDAGRVGALVRSVLVDPVDWPRELEAVGESGAHWLLDLGPGDGSTRLCAEEARMSGLGRLAVTAHSGLRELTVAGAAPSIPRAWSGFAPTAVELPDGSRHVETRFTRLTGRSPILLAGMTPTTVDPAIVAAAANAGHWAELAGGGQVSPEVFDAAVARLASLLEPGRTYAFNALYLDPYLWRLHIGVQRLVPRARAAGAAVDAVVVSAGVPELDEAVALVRDLRAAGIEYVVFKPGTVAQIRQVLAIADAVADVPLVVQIEGGKAGGHHSWEDLDELLLATYGDLRSRENVVVCVGGGIGTPAAAARYLSGEWAARHGYPPMPLDGVLVGTAAMACLEATTSPEVKRLLAGTPGTPDWVRPGTVSGGMTSGRSQLGADLHEVDNAAARAGRLLDEVSGDAEAVAARRAEIVEALRCTAKPYFGDVAGMTYAQWLTRFHDLARRQGPQDPAAEDGSGWLDVTLRDRFHAMVHRAEARLAEPDHGPTPTLFAAAQDVEDGRAALDALREAYPLADEVVLHPADVGFFVAVCRRPGKPVPFVPVLDAEVRRWWRADSLWQSHDERFAADAVTVIPGPVSVAGITTVDEPVADLLARFEAGVLDSLAAAREPVGPVSGRRRDAGSTGAVSLVLAAPDVQWSGRTVRNPVRRLGENWVVVASDRAEHPATGAVLETFDAEQAQLSIPMGEGSLRLRLGAGPAVMTGAAPEVLGVTGAMRTLLDLAAGGRRPTGTVAWDPDLVADHAAVTGTGHPQARPIPDVLVGLTWPDVFAALARRDDLVEGALDLVHLDHSVVLGDPRNVAGDEAVAVAVAGSTLSGLPPEPVSLRVDVEVQDVVDTEAGRVASVAVTLRYPDADPGPAREGTSAPAGSTPSGRLVAQLLERFAIRGRTGTAAVPDSPPVGPAEVRSAPARRRAEAVVVAPLDARPFAEVTGDHNPLHIHLAAAQLAGLSGPIMHGMWLSAVAQRVLVEQTRRPLTSWSVRFLAPVRPGDAVRIQAHRTGTVAGDEILTVVARVDDQVVLSGSGRLAAPRTAYVFPGQGIQHAGMGMAGYRSSRAAREVWHRADAHTRATLGFSVLQLVQENPVELVADGRTHRHPDGVLFLTQFTQVAMAVLASAQMAQLREVGAAVDDAVFAGHSVGEYNALAGVCGVLSLEAVVEVVFRRGSVMHTLVPRDEHGRSGYRMAAIRPSQFGVADAEVRSVVERVATESGEFLEIANYNQRDTQYAVAGTVAGLEALEREVEQRRARHGGRRAFVLVPGVDVPFHSAVLRDGVEAFRRWLEELLPREVDPALLTGRYVPNLVARPFELDADFLTAILQVVPSRRIEDVLADLPGWRRRPGQLCRLVLIELLAWQFASPVRWIETQDLLFAAPLDGGLGIQRLVEIGVGRSPTLANLAAATLREVDAQRAPAEPVEVLNVERDEAVVLATDEDPAEDPTKDPAEESDARPLVETASPAAGAGSSALQAAPVAVTAATEQRPGDLDFGPADATRLLLAWWTKIRTDQLGAADTIEGLCDGVSSRRNQLLMDLGAEFGVGAVDGAAEAEFAVLCRQLAASARSYRALGPVLSVAVQDHLKKVLGPVGVRSSRVTDRVSGHWQLGPGWAMHTLVEVAAGTREGPSVRGGQLATLELPSSPATVDALVDAALQQVAGRHGITVAAPAAAGGAVTVDAAALADATAPITDALLATARSLVEALDRDRTGEDTHDLGAGPALGRSGPADSVGSDVLARVESELGRDWVTATAPSFDPRRAVLLDDRWAGAREDVARIAAGEAVEAEFAGAGAAVAEQARWFGLRGIAAVATEADAGAWAAEVAVVTGAAQGSIAAAIVGDLLAGGATVVATTSRLDERRLGFFTDLYRRRARVGAALWVVPANLACFADVDAVVDWVREEQVEASGPNSVVVKPALRPTLLFPFAAGPVLGSAAEASGGAEVQARILLWSVERLVGAHWGSPRLHVVLPGSPNRGRFGGDGAYGEAKAGLDALVAKWHSERSWADRVTIAHPLIGWVRGTGLMGGNDPLVDAVESAGARTWSAQEMSARLLELCTPQARAEAAAAPIQVDLGGGLDRIDLPALLAARSASPTASSAAATDDDVARIPALPPSPGQVAEPPAPSWGQVSARPEELVVLVGAGELGPWGSARTRYEVEVADELSAAGVLELAWVTGLVRYDEAAASWYDVASGDLVDEAELHDRYHDEVVGRCGIRSFVDDGAMTDHSKPVLASVYLEHDLTFTVGSEAEARAVAADAPQHTRVLASADGEWRVTRLAGSEIRVPRRAALTRTAGGQLPTGFDPRVWGVPAEMVDAIDRVALWNLVCTVDAFLSSGFTPTELLRWVHPARVANTQGTGLGGIRSMRGLYIDALLGESTQNDLLQEALPNVIAAHVVQSYVGSYGPMVHPVAACATAAVSVEEAVDKIRLGKADVVVAGGFDDLGPEGVAGFAAMSATADTGAMRARGIDDRALSRPNDRRRGGFVESQGGGTLLLARGDVADRLGLPVLGVLAYAASFGDGIHTSIPAPGIGALAAGMGGADSSLATSLAALGVGADDIAVVSKHDTSTAANDPNESDLHERLATALGRSAGNPLYVVSQKSLTGHAKGGAAAFQLVGMCQVLSGGVVPPNRNLDCVDPALAVHPHLVWLRRPLRTGPLRAGLVTSLGFGHVSGLLAVVHPEAFVRSLPPARRSAYQAAARERVRDGRMRLARAMLGEPAYRRPPGRRLAAHQEREQEAALLLDRAARLGDDDRYA